MRAICLRSLLRATACVVFLGPTLWADVIDAQGTFQETLDAVLLDLHGGRWTPESLRKIEEARAEFGGNFSDPAGLAIWNAPAGRKGSDEVSVAVLLGEMQAKLQHAAGLEMLKRQRAETAARAVEGIVEGSQVDEGPATTQDAGRSGIARRAAAKMPT